MKFEEYLNESTFKLTPEKVDDVFYIANKYDFLDKTIKELVVKSIYDVLREMQEMNVIGRKWVFIGEAMKMLEKYAKKSGREKELKEYEQDTQKRMALENFFFKIHNIVK